MSPDIFRTKITFPKKKKFLCYYIRKRSHKPVSWNLLRRYLLGAERLKQGRALNYDRNHDVEKRANPKDGDMKKNIEANYLKTQIKI